MPQGTDFRQSPFDVQRVQASGRHVGRNVYWKLYTIENLVRVVVHSVLSAQINAGWWSTAVDPTIARKGNSCKISVRKQTLAQPARFTRYLFCLPP